MTQNAPEDSRSPALSFWGYCEYYFWPHSVTTIPCLGVFSCPLPFGSYLIREFFDLIRLFLRGLTSAFCLFLLYITYRQICKIAGIPAAIGRHVGSETS